jgi:cytochrome P450
VAILRKKSESAEIFFSLIKRGLFFIEGQEWRHRRKTLSKAFNFDFIVQHIPTMVKVADQTFDEFEAKARAKGELTEGKMEFETDIVELLIKFTSSVVVSEFLGFEALKEKLRDKPIVESIRELLVLGASSLQDPLLFIFGKKLLNRRWRKYDRDFLDLSTEVNAVLKNYIARMEEEIKN